VRFLAFFPLALAACSATQSSTDNKDPVVADSGETGLGDDTAAGTDSDSGGDDTGATGPVDADGDGYTEDQDCDDTNAQVNPGMPEICNDGLDDNCDGHSDADDDLDGDGISDCDDYCPVYASWGATGDGRVLDPVGSIQEAVDLAGSTGCNEARAYQGTYYENVDWGGWSVNAESVSGPDVTIVDGGGGASVIRFATAETADARIYGFTLTNGGGTAGAGIYISGASPVIEGNLITGNGTTGYNHLGGGIYAADGSPTIIDNEIRGNDAGYGGEENGCDGGAINIRRGEPYIARNLILDNTAGDGGGIWTAYSDAIIVNNLIAGNAAMDVDEEAGGQGGGINVQIAGPSETLVIANVIADNVASMFGGGIVTYEANDAYGEARIENNVIAFNEVTDTDYGAGFCQWRRTTPTVTNNILYANYGVGAYSEDGIDATWTYNLVWANFVDLDGLAGDGAGNLSADPRFVDASADGDPENDDYTLRSTSSARDAGDPSLSDPDGSRSDMGAYGGPSGAW